MAEGVSVRFRGLLLDRKNHDDGAAPAQTMGRSATHKSLDHCGYFTGSGHAGETSSSQIGVYCDFRIREHVADGGVDLPIIDT